MEKAVVRQSQPINLSKPDVMPMPIKRGLNNVYTFTQTVILTSITTTASSGVEVDVGYQMTFNMLDGASSLVAVFDQYKIPQYTITFLPRFNLESSGGATLGTFYTALDYDDANSTTALNLRQKETCMVTPAWKPHVRTINPHIAIGAYSGAFTSFANMAPQWIDVASVNVQHYAIKAALTNSSTTSTVIYDVFARVVVQCRQVQ